MNLFDVYPLFPIEPVRGEGCYLYDKEGTEYLDFYGGHAVISIGHCHPHFVKRVTEQVQKLPFYSNAIINSLQSELAEKLGKVSGYTDYQLFLVNSGAEAIENALKLASFHTGRKKVISFKKGFHGRTAAAVAATDNPKIQAPVNESLFFEKFDFGEIEAIEKALKTEEFAAVLIEGIQGVGGIRFPGDEFLRALRKITEETGTCLIVDNIQCGYGRSGKFFSHDHSGIKPDMITMAKGMGNGFPVGGVVIAPHIKASYGLLGTTFGGNHAACAAALAVLEVIEEEELLKNAETMGSYLMNHLKDLPGLLEIRGRGLMIGLEFQEPIRELRSSLLMDEKIFTGISGDSILRLLPPLTMSQKEADRLINSLKKLTHS